MDRRPSHISDDQELARLGKKQVLARRFGFWSLFGFAVCELITWETVLALFDQGFENGGPGGLVYGFIIAWSSTLSVYTVISELASMAPIAAGQYYWSYIMAPPRARVFVSYIIGWLTTLAWIATVATECMFAGTMLQGLLVIDYPDYSPKRWQGTLLTWLVVLVSVFFNVIIPAALPRIEIGTVVFHIAGFISIITVLWCFSPRHSAEFVFATSMNEGGWSTQGLSYCVGFMGNVATFVGADASVHLAEEVSDAAVNIPRVITTSMLLNGVIGFVMMVTLLFCLGDVNTVLNTETGFPFIQVFHDNIKSIPWATVMGAIILILTWACATGITTSASRMTWAFARDRGVPFASTLMKVDRRTRVPIIAVGVVVMFACLLSLIYIGSSVAFNDVISLTITGFYGSYLVPSAFLLYHRVRGHILPHEAMLVDGQPTTAEQPGSAQSLKTPVMEEKKTSPSPSQQQHEQDNDNNSDINSNLIAYAPGQLFWGPWKVPGLLGTLNNAYACLYMIFVIFWSVWPPSQQVTASTMNYSILVTGGVILFSVFWYYVRGRKEYVGPLVEREVVALSGILREVV